MKRIAWVLLIGLWCGSLAMAQIGNFTQRGKATQELKTDGISIAHPSLPLNTTVTITNTKTGKSIEATVSARVPASTSRIADLSPGAWQELGLDADGEITISTAPRPRPRLASATPPADTAQTTPPAPATEPTDTPPAGSTVAQGSPAASSTENQPFTITLHNFITLPPEDDKTPPPSGTPRPAPRPARRPAARPPAVAVVATPPPQTPPQPQQYVPDPDLQRRLAATAAYASPQPIYAVPPPAPTAPPPAAPPPAPIIQPQLVVVPSYNLTVAPVYQTQQMTTIHQSPPAPVPPPPPAPPPAPPPPPAYQPPPPPPVPAYLPPPPIAYLPPPPLSGPPPVAYQPPPPLPQPAPPPSATTVRVIPGYPDPNSTRLYTLQVGAYSTANAANKAESLLRNNGFNVNQELSKPYYRIIISGVQASTIHSLVQRLGAAGVEEVIIR